jgi:hypothetical protein
LTVHVLLVDDGVAACEGVEILGAGPIPPMEPLLAPPVEPPPELDPLDTNRRSIGPTGAQDPWISRLLDITLLEVCK